QFHQFARWLAELAMQTDKGVVLATALVQELRREKVVLPPINVIERVCALAITRANRKIYLTLADALNDSHRVLLEGLLRQPTGSTSSTLAWLRQTPGAPSAKHFLEHLQRLNNRGARSTRTLAASNPSEPMAETSSRRRSDDRATFARPRDCA